MVMQLNKTPMGVPCPACGVLVVDYCCPSCGLALEEPQPSHWPAVHDRLALDPVVEIATMLPAAEGTAHFTAFDENGKLYDLFFVESGDPNGLLAKRAARRAKEPLCLQPDAILRLDNWLIERTPLTGFTALPDLLTELLQPSAPDPVKITETYIIPLAQYASDLHSRGYFIGSWAPDDLLFDNKTGQLRFRDPPDFHSQDAAWELERRYVYTGLTAPELYGRCGGMVDTRADVFFLGVTLHCMLTHTAPAPEAALSIDRLPPAVVFNETLPPDISAVIRKACSPLPWRRYNDAIAFLSALEHAIVLTQLRQTSPHKALTLDIGHELHIGVLKGQFAPINQDIMFLAWHESSATGLFVISDGVSISHYGSGDQASACVRHQAEIMWRELTEGRFAPPELKYSGRPCLPRSNEDRRAILLEIINRANAEIASIINERIPVFAGPPEGIMAATAILALVEGNRLTLGSIGDSRIYLVRDGNIVTLMPDHDLSTQLIRMGRPISASKSAPSAAALVRCVGEFEKESDHLVPVPLRPELREITLLPGDTILLCSDGIPDYAGSDEEDGENRMRKAIEDADGAPWAAFDLMVLANRGGGGDNISCIVLSFGEETFA